MDIFKYFKQKGIDTIDKSFYRKIEEWESWYVSNVKKFSFYRVYYGRGNYKRCQRKSMGMAKKLAEDIADLLLNEKVKVTLSDEATNSFVQQILEENQFLVLGNDYQERKAATGTVAYVPYLYDTENDEDGKVTSGKIGINYVSAEHIFPVSWNNGRVSECVFAFPYTVNYKKYVLLQFHHKAEDGLYVIDNTVLEIVAGSQDGKEIPPEKWKELAPFANVAERSETGLIEPQFVIDRLNIVNNADKDKSNPMGVAVFANAIDTLKKLDLQYDSYCNEFELGKKRIFVSPELLTNHDGSPAFDPDDSVFYSLPEDYKTGNGEADLLREIDMNIRAEAHSKAISDDLNYLSLKCGFGTERYRFDGTGVKTATEVISENSDLYRMLKKHEIILESAIKELVRIIIRLGIATGNALNIDTDIVIDFDDSIIEDKTAERQQDRQDVSMGAMTLEEYRAKWYGETIEEARSKIVSEEVTPDEEEE